MFAQVVDPVQRRLASEDLGHAQNEDACNVAGDQRDAHQYDQAEQCRQPGMIVKVGPKGLELNPELLNIHKRKRYPKSKWLMD